MSLADIKRGKPVSFTVNYLGTDLRYMGMDFSVQIHDISEISEIPGVTHLPPARGLEKTIVTVNPKRTTKEGLENQEGPVPLEIRPELERSIRIHSISYGFSLRETTFVYPCNNQS